MLQVTRVSQGGAQSELGECRGRPKVVNVRHELEEVHSGREPAVISSPLVAVVSFLG